MYKVVIEVKVRVWVVWLVVLMINLMRFVLLIGIDMLFIVVKCIVEMLYMYF